MNLNTLGFSDNHVQDFCNRHMIPFLDGIAWFLPRFKFSWSFARLGCNLSESCEDDMSSNMIVLDGPCNSSLKLRFSFEVWPIITVIETNQNTKHI